MAISLVTNEDNLLMMSRYQNGFFELANDDPPYFKGPEKRGFYGNKQSSIGVSRIYEKTDEWSLPTITYFNELKRVSVNQIIWGANYFDFIGEVHKTPRRHELDEWLSAHPIGWIVWDKCNGSSSFNDFELAWTSFDSPTIVYKFMWNGMLHGSSIFNGHIMKGDKSKNQKRIHPTEKPFEIYQWCNYQYQPKNILSNYVGSGSDRIVANEMDIDFYGSEIDEIHFKNQQKRFLLTISQQKLELI